MTTYVLEHLFKDDWRTLAWIRGFRNNPTSLPIYEQSLQDCKIYLCKEPQYVKGVCRHHYELARKGEKLHQIDLIT